MDYNLIKENVHLREKIGTEKTQLMLTGDIIVPDIKPDINSVLQRDYEIIVDSVDLEDAQLHFKGTLILKILYLSKGDSKAIHSMTTSITIDDFLNVDESTSPFDFLFNMDVLNIDYTLLNDRKLSFKAIVDVTVDCNKNLESDIIVGIDELNNSQLKFGSININQFLGTLTDKIVLKDHILLRNGTPNISELLQTNLKVTNKDIKIINDRICVTGFLNFTWLYKGTSSESLIEVVEHEVPFENFFDFQDLSDDVHCELYLDIQDRFMSVSADDDGEDRRISFEAVISLTVKLSKCVEKSMLTDVFILNKKSDLSYKSLSFDKLITRNKSQFVVKEVVSLDDNKPNILQVFEVTSKCVVDDMTLLTNKVLLEGVVETNILYIAEDDNNPLCTFKCVTPFSQIVETKGALESMSISSSSFVEHTSFNLINDRDIDLRITLNLNVLVENHEVHDVIEAVAFSELNEEELNDISSVTIYIVQKGDTLWDISKKYNTTVDDILSVNDIDDPSKIKPLDKLVIIKKVML